MATWRTVFSKIILSYQGRIGKDPREIIYPVTSLLTVKHKSHWLIPTIFYICIVLSSQSAFKDIIPINPCKEIGVLFWGQKKLWAQKWSVPVDLQNFSDLMIDVWNVLIKDCSIKIHIHSWNEYIHRESHWELMGTLPFWSCNSSVLIWTVSLSSSQDDSKDRHKGLFRQLSKWGGEGKWRVAPPWSWLLRDWGGGGGVYMFWAVPCPCIPLVGNVWEEQALDGVTDIRGQSNGCERKRDSPRRAAS